MYTLSKTKFNEGFRFDTDEAITGRNVTYIVSGYKQVVQVKDGENIISVQVEDKGEIRLDAVFGKDYVQVTQKGITETQYLDYSKGIDVDVAYKICKAKIQILVLSKFLCKYE